MNRILYLFLILGAVFLLVGGFLLFQAQNNEVEAPSSQNNQPTVTPTPTPTPTPSPSGQPNNQQSQTHTVTYTASGYSPKELQIKQGDTVVFKNQSSTGMWTASAVHPEHAVYSGTSLSQHCPNGTDAFDACRQIPAGGEWSFTF